jgi:branched-chain amino acid transport system ATP-binding protein
MTMPLLAVDGLEVVYHRVITAVQDVSLTVEKGSIVGVVGLNGAGKTTTLRAISGFLPAEDADITKGRIVLDGTDITGWRPHRVARSGMALVPERSKVFQTLTVEENLAVASSASSNGRGVLSSDEVFRLFPVLDERRRTRGVYLSGGEQQMLSIAMALLGAPRLLLVDEASLGLAPKFVAEIMATLERIKQELGVTVLVVDQNAEAVFSISDHGYVMENGRVVFADATERLLRHADVKEFYLGLGREGARSYRAVKQYRRTRRWWG